MQTELTAVCSILRLKAPPPSAGRRAARPWLPGSSTACPPRPTILTRATTPTATCLATRPATSFCHRGRRHRGRRHLGRRHRGRRHRGRSRHQARRRPGRRPAKAALQQSPGCARRPSTTDQGSALAALRPTWPRSSWQAAPRPRWQRFAKHARSTRTAGESHFLNSLRRHQATTENAAGNAHPLPRRRVFFISIHQVVMLQLSVCNSCNKY